MEDHVVELDPTQFTGNKKLVYFVVTAATNVYLDAWQFTDAGVDGISELNNSQPVMQQSYDLSGRRLSNSRQHRGIVVEQYIDKNGVKHSRKSF